jgi:predicted flap endonuclease-1-like 5' DNA nuclease
MDNVSNFLTGLTTEESLFFLAFILGGFLLGILLGSLLRSATVRRLKKDLAKKNEELIDLQGQHNELTQKYAQQESAFKAIKTEKDELASKLTIVEEENNKLNKTVFQLNNEYDKLKSSSQSYESTIEDLNDQIIGLKSKIENMSMGSTPDTSSEGIESTSTSPEEQVVPESPMVVDLSGEIDRQQEERLNLLEEKLEHLMGENDLLRREMEAIKEDRLDSGPSPIIQPEPETEVAQNDPFFPQDGADLNTGISNMPETSVTGAFSSRDRSLGSVAATDENADIEKDDLTLIEGIGPFIEQKLNDIGIYTYEQISQFEDADIEEVTEKIQFFEGRIEKDDWVNQAQSLHQIKLQNPQAFASSPDEDKGPEIIVDVEVPEPQKDLKIIEGIGPKIEGLLKESNIQTVQDIAAASVTHLKEVLEEGGEKFRLHDPTTWPAQARLAVNGDWELLKEYQEKLKGGREVDEKE